MNSIIFFNYKDTSSCICYYLNIVDLDNLRLSNKEFAKIFKDDHKKKMIQFRLSLNTREDLFAKPYYPRNTLKEIYQKEKQSYSNGYRLNIFWNKKLIGYVRYKTFGDDSRLPNNWNGYFFMETDDHEYNEDNQIQLRKYKGCNIQEITYSCENTLGFDHAHGWDFQSENYTNLESIKNEVVAMYLAYNKLQPFPQYA